MGFLTVKCLQEQTPSMFLRNHTPGQLILVAGSEGIWFLDASYSRDPKRTPYFHISGSFPFFFFFWKWEDLLQSPASSGGNWNGVSWKRWICWTLGVPRISELKKTEMGFPSTLMTEISVEKPSGLHTCFPADLWKKELQPVQAGLSLGWTTGQQA